MTWQQFKALEPRGETRADVRSALSTAHLYNVVIAAVGGKKFRDVKDFMIDYERRSDRGTAKAESVGSKKPLSPERWKEIKRQFKQAVASGAKIG